MNRNQSESIERVDETKPRTRRALAAIGDVDDASERAFASRTARTTGTTEPTEPMEPSERAFAREIYPYQNPRFTTRQSRLTSRGSVFPSPDSRRAGSIEIKDVFHRSNRTMSSDRSGISPDRLIDRSSSVSFVFPRDSRARSRQNRLIRSMFARRRAVAAATRCAARSFV